MPARSLTPRQREILILAASGATVPEIAAELGISQGTVYERLFFIRSKLNAPDNSYAAALAAVCGEIEVETERLSCVLAPVFDSLEDVRGPRGQSFFSCPDARDELARTLVSSQR